MVHIITQETFNETVIENMSLFELEAEEAILETVDQFKSQGVDLANIIKDRWCVLGEEDPLAAALDRLSLDSTAISESIDTVIGFCNKDLSYKLKAAKLGAYDKIVHLLKDSKDTNTICKCLDALCALMDGYPDLLDANGVDLLFSMLNESDERTTVKVLEWARLCCIKHEKNRKLFMDWNINDVLKKVLEVKGKHLKVASGVCQLAGSLTYDDDIRDAVSGSHVHACVLASSLLPSFVSLLKVQDSAIVSQVLNTVSSVLVRDTLCQQFVDLGGLECLLKVLSEDPSVKILTRGFNVLGCLAGHDEIKDAIIKAGLAPRISHSLENGQDSLHLCRSVLSLVARLSLRSATNSKSLYEAGLGESIVQIMKIYPSDEKIQSLSCLAIRNLVSHNRDLRPKFLALEIEDLLRIIPNNFPDLADNSKSTLLALDLNVNLKEEWTGKYGDKVKANS